MEEAHVCPTWSCLGPALRGAKPMKAEPEHFPSEDSILPPFPAEPCTLESVLDPLLWVVVIPSYGAVGQL